MSLDANYMQSLRSFMAAQTRLGRVIAYDPIYTDMAGDVLAGLVLSQICFWHRASEKTGKTRLRVAKDGRLWAAISVKDMQEDTHMTPAQITRCYNLLAKKGLIIKRVWRFAGTPTTHISLNWPVFEAEMRRCEDALVEDVSFEEDNEEIGDAQIPAISVKPKSDSAPTKSGFTPHNKSDSSPVANHYTDITDTTTKSSSRSTETQAAPAPAHPKRSEQNAIRKAVADHFQEITGLTPMGKEKTLGRLWWNPIREICTMSEWDEQKARRLVSLAVDKLAGLTVSDPNSILKTCRALAAQGMAPPQEKGPSGPIMRMEQW